ncbi:MAG: hypothetical protein ABWY64_09460 [Tardiphaga sp.]|jgi:hypothetical protein
MALAQDLESQFSKDTWPSEAMIQPADPGSKRASLVKRASRGLARFLIIFCIGVTATLAWQSYGNAAREMIANSSPQLGWLVPSASSSPEQKLKAMSTDFATVRQRVDQVAANQQRMAGDIAKLMADQQELLQKISVPLPQAAAVPVRRPVLLPSSEAR